VVCSSDARNNRCRDESSHNHNVHIPSLVVFPQAGARIVFHELHV
jgi:hypothetical protein